jgi:hypothetical protein
VKRLFQVFSELKQMTIPSAALRSDVVASIGDEVVRYTRFYQLSEVIFPTVQYRNAVLFTTPNEQVPVYTVFYNRFAQLDFSKKRDT